MKRGTTQKIAKQAAKILDNPSSSTVAKRLAGSALTQSKAPSERTSATLATLASRVLQDGRFSNAAHTLAATVLAQRKK
jgi:hypothetical protein